MTLNERKMAARENSMKASGHPREVARIVGNLASEDFTFAATYKIVIHGGTEMLECLSLKIKRKKT
ncbi:MAG: hypothetical protein M3136_12475 [Thermoproteota archaeon]|nr:hypothetical protein [Thermoproteota archaeon]